MGEYGKYRPLVRVALLLFCLFAASSASACRLALILALDVSSSVDEDEDSLQRRGLAQALLAPDVEAAFFASPAPVKLAVFEWSGRYNQAEILPWTTIRTKAELIGAAARIGASTRVETEFPTALGYALGHGSTLFRDVPECLFKTIDVSGDGENNDGFGPKDAYAAFAFDGITVNGLAIDTTGTGDGSPLVQYYSNEVLHGPGAFVEIADGFADYANAMERKLLRELQAIVLSAAQ